MARIEHAMEINAPAHLVYDQLLRFEEYPRFMQSVRAVRRIDGRHLRWQVQAGARDVEWDTEITQQVPGQRIAWRGSGEARFEGRMELDTLDGPDGTRAGSGARTRLRLIIDSDAAGWGAADGGAMDAMMARRVEQDLVRFKKCVETPVLERWPGQSALRHPQAWTEGEERGGGAERVERIERIEAAAREDGAGMAYRRRKAEQAGAFPALDLRPPWLPAFLPAWENPLRIMRRMSQGMDKIVDGVMAGARLDAHRAAGRANDAYRNGGAWSPLVEVTRSDDSVVVVAELAGVRREDVQIDIRADRLMIEGDRHPQQAGHPGEARRSERSYGHFYRVVDLPLGADPEAATASMRDGLLEIRVPVRRGAAERRRLNIEAPE